MLKFSIALASPWFNSSEAGAASKGIKALQRLARVRSGMITGGTNKLTTTLLPKKGDNAFEANKEIGACGN